MIFTSEKQNEGYKTEQVNIPKQVIDIWRITSHILTYYNQQKGVPIDIHWKIKETLFTGDLHTALNEVIVILINNCKSLLKMSVPKAYPNFK